MSDEQGLVAGQDASRERQMELRRREIALRAEARALREHCLDGVHRPRRLRAALIHRQPCLLDRPTGGLNGHGMHVVAAVDDGVRGSGIAIAEAPELVFLEAALPAMSGVEVTCRVRQCNPGTVVAAQVPIQRGLAGAAGRRRRRCLVAAGSASRRARRPRRAAARPSRG